MRKINITIKMSDLMMETSKWGYTVGENIGDDAAKQRYFIQGPTDAGHADLIRTAFDDAWAELLQILSAYLSVNECECGCVDCACAVPVSENESGGYDSSECDDFSAVLYFPDNTRPTLAANIGRLARRYMLMKARAEWETVTRQDPSLSASTAEMTARRLKVEITGRTTVGKLKKWNYGY